MYAKIIDLKVGDRVRNSRLGEGVVIKALGTKEPGVSKKFYLFWRSESIVVQITNNTQG